jgi:DNA-binding MarR family transcriptional regulator
MGKETLTRELSADVAGACACDKIRKAARKITGLYNEALNPADLKATQFTILAAVCLKEGETLSDLAAHLGMERTTFLRNLKPLERRGLAKTFEEGHGRARSVRLTGKGVQLMEKALPLWRHAQKSLRKELGADVWTRVHRELGVIAHLG